MKLFHSSALNSAPHKSLWWQAQGLAKLLPNLDDLPLVLEREPQQLAIGFHCCCYAGVVGSCSQLDPLLGKPAMPQWVCTANCTERDQVCNAQRLSWADIVDFQPRLGPLIPTKPCRPTKSFASEQGQPSRYRTDASSGALQCCS